MMVVWYHVQLQVIGSGVALTQGEVDKDKYSKIYDASELSTQNEALLRDACATRPGSQPLHFNRTYVRSVCEQLGAVCKRQVLSAWRNTALNCTLRAGVAVAVAVCARVLCVLGANTSCICLPSPVSRLVIMIVLSLAFGLLFYQLDSTSDRAGVNSLNGCVDLGVTGVGVWVGVTTTYAVPGSSPSRPCSSVSSS